MDDIKVQHEVVSRDGQEVCRIWFEGNLNKRRVFYPDVPGGLLATLIEQGHLSFEIDMHGFAYLLNDDADDFINTLIAVCVEAWEKGQFLNIAIVRLSDKLKDKLKDRLGWRPYAYSALLDIEGLPPGRLSREDVWARLERVRVERMQNEKGTVS